MPGTPTTKYSIPTLNASGTDAINVSHTALNSAFTTIDGAMAGYAEGTFAGKPAAGKAGRLYRCTDTGQWLADTGTVWVDLNAAPALVSSLPGSPFDGQEIYYSADPTNGVVWHLRYRSAAGGSYKWEFVGGGQLTAEVAAAEFSNSSSYVDLATVGPSITVPLAGDYEVAFGAEMTAGSTLSTFVAVKFGAAAASDADAVRASTSLGAATVVDYSVARTMRRNLSTAASTVKLVYKAPTGAGATAANRFLAIRPVRVG